MNGRNAHVSPTSADRDTRRPARQALRASMRERRGLLTAGALATADERLAGHLHAVLSPCALVGGYLAINGEMPVTTTLGCCSARGAVTALPVLSGARMTFVTVDDTTMLVTRRFGLIEPAGGEPLDPMTLEAVLLPLVAFDAHGNRLGMGGGYYDRCFEQVPARRAAGLPTPRLIGVAHAFQQVPRLQAEPWDVPLDQVVTDAGVVPARNSR